MKICAIGIREIRLLIETTAIMGYNPKTNNLTKRT